MSLLRKIKSDVDWWQKPCFHPNVLYISKPISRDSAKENANESLIPSSTVMHGPREKAQQGDYRIEHQLNLDQWQTMQKTGWENGIFVCFIW